MTKIFDPVTAITLIILGLMVFTAAGIHNTYQRDYIIDNHCVATGETRKGHRGGEIYKLRCDDGEIYEVTR